MPNSGAVFTETVITATDDSVPLMTVTIKAVMVY